jgi:hypothetical protein
MNSTSLLSEILTNILGVFQNLTGGLKPAFLQWSGNIC